MLCTFWKKKKKKSEMVSFIENLRFPVSKQYVYL